MIEPAPRMASHSPYGSSGPSLLARKGEAIPALDAGGHARVITGSKQMMPGPKHVLDNKSQSQFSNDWDAIERGYTGESVAPEPTPEPVVQEKKPERIIDFLRGRGAKKADTPQNPRKNKRPGSQLARVRAALLRREKDQSTDAKSDGPAPRRAAVTFRMSIHDFLRLKLASSEVGASCQALILDAISGHLDDQEIETVDNAMPYEEVAQLLTAMKRPA